MKIEMIVASPVPLVPHHHMTKVNLKPITFLRFY
jgi:hypothetical protein